MGIEPRSPLLGIYLVVAVENCPALLPGAAVQEVVRPVENSPIPDSPPWVLGSFVFRGRPVVTVDLAQFLGRPARPPSLDAHVVVLGTGSLMGVLVDQVRGVVESPVALDAETGRAGIDGSSVFGQSTLVHCLCRVGEHVLPLLRISRLLEALP